MSSDSIIIGTWYDVKAGPVAEDPGRRVHFFAGLTLHACDIQRPARIETICVRSGQPGNVCSGSVSVLHWQQF